jgi:magnesium transporter
MPFVSNILGKRVVDADGEQLGKIVELYAAVRESMAHPRLTAIETKHRSKRYLIPFKDVAALIPPVVPLLCRLAEVKPYKPAKDDIYIVRDILDKQIIDTDGVRVVRVNDLELVRANGNVYIANVDVSGAGLMRRLGLPHRTPRPGKPGEKPPAGFISWDNVELISADQPMRLKVPGDKMTELHPADLAELLSDLSRQEGKRLLQSLDNETLADTLEEVEPDFQVSLIEEIPNARVADVLEEMSPDEAADLLAELPKKRSREILRMMKRDEAEDVEKLLAYPEDSAGGIMNTEFVAVPESLPAAQVVASLRKEAPDSETIYYIYVTDREKRIKGVFSLRELILAEPNVPVRKFMEDRVVTVNIKDRQDEVARIIAKYNLLAVPVVDDQNRIHGIVTADDALDKIIPTTWKKRLPKFYH